tara:strand:- start:1100 stop:1546 length:447 start_codon:yes stop_codon:yes gene_type:complete
MEKTKSKKVILQRVWMDENQSTGSLIVLDELRQPIYINPCIERGDRNNEQNVSNVPTGTYPLVWENSPKFGMVWELKDVPNRSECKIHAANMWNQINGCIAPGTYLGELNDDGYYDTLASVDALKRFHLALEDMQEQGTTITIFNSYL